MEDPYGRREDPDHIVSQNSCGLHDCGLVPQTPQAGHNITFCFCFFFNVTMHDFRSRSNPNDKTNSGPTTQDSGLCTPAGKLLKETTPESKTDKRWRTPSRAPPKAERHLEQVALCGEQTHKEVTTLKQMIEQVTTLKHICFASGMPRWCTSNTPSCQSGTIRPHPNKGRPE